MMSPDTVETLRAIGRQLQRPFVDSLQAFRIWLAALIDPPTYTYFVGAPVGEIEAGKSTDIDVDVMTPYQVVDMVASGPAGIFQIESMFFGTCNMLRGVCHVPADLFFPSVENRGIRSVWLEKGDKVQMRIRNTSSKKATLVITFKVKSYRSHA